MKLLASPLRFVLLPALLCVWMPPAVADIWDDPQNLKILPKDISPEALQATMRGFATNTGSRCSTCHVADDVNDITTFDFSLDDKEEKRKARHMMRLVADINDYLQTELGKPAAELVQVDCATCHHSQQKPEMIEDVIARSRRAQGMETAIADYRQLRDRYYGDYVYDFSPKALMKLAETLAADDNFEDAVRFLDLNLEFYPASARTHVLKAHLLTDKGDNAGARRSLLAAIELEPENPWPRELLERLDQQ